MKFHVNFHLFVVIISTVFVLKTSAASVGNGTTEGSTLEANYTSENEVSISDADDLVKKIEIKSTPEKETRVTLGENLELKIVLKLLTESIIKSAMTLTARKGSSAQEMYRCKDKHGPFHKAKSGSGPATRDRNLDCHCPVCESKKSGGFFSERRMRPPPKKSKVSKNVFTEITMVVYDMLKPDNETTFTMQIGKVTVFKTKVIVQKETHYAEEHKRGKMKSSHIVVIAIASVICGVLIGFCVFKMVFWSPSAPVAAAAIQTSSTDGMQPSEVEVIAQPPSYETLAYPTKS